MVERVVRIFIFAWFMTTLGGLQAHADIDQDDPAGESVTTKKALPLTVYWKDDFCLSTPDEKFLLKIRGNLHFDSKFYTNDESANPAQFDIRRARIDFQGRLYDTIRFRVQAEFADNPYIRNAWADYELRPWLHLRAGQMKPPFSTSWWTKDNNVNFLERGANTPLYPYFDRGFWVWGDFSGGAVTYNVAAFTGAGMDYDNRKGDIDDHKDAFLRFFFAPFMNMGIETLKGLHFCVQGSSGRQSIPTGRFEKKGFGAAVRDDRFWTWETESTGRGEIGRRDRWGAEIHYIYGPFAFSSEYIVARYDDIEVFATDGTKVIDEEGSIASWSTWISFFLTGEQKQVSNFGWKQPKPKRNFHPARKTGPGSWEILARYTRTETDEDLFRPVQYGDADYMILKGAHKVDEYTVGIAWGWNPMVRWQLNYVYLACNDRYGGIRTGDKDNKDGLAYVETEQMIGLRMIFKF